MSEIFISILLYFSFVYFIVDKFMGLLIWIEELTG